MNYEFYETPAAFTRWLFGTVPIVGRIGEVCVGSRAICEAVSSHSRQWVTNDLDPRWPADYHLDASTSLLYEHIEHGGGPLDWVVTNPPFSPAISILTQAIAHARIGVAMHLRASIHEVLKTGVRRTWMAEHTPSGILWLPRFAYQRSQKTGKWTTDSVCACWVIWLRAPVKQFIRYAPESVIDDLEVETPAFRARMDRLMGGARD